MDAAHAAPPAAAAAADPPQRAVEEPWRRDEVVNLLRAWRDVAVDIANSSSSASKPDAPGAKARIFERFCSYYASTDSSDGAPRAPPRSFKSLMKTKKSLLRSYRFIAMFNQNHVIARSMSALGGSNWFALPDDEQRRVVSAHYKRKPFAYIDEDMFDAIAMIQETENPSASGLRIDARDSTGLAPDASPRTPSENASGRTPLRDQHGKFSTSHGASTPTSSTLRSDAAVGAGLPPRSSRTPPATPDTALKAPSAATNPNATNAWTRDDILQLLHAWEATFDDPRVQNEPVAVFDQCVHQAFGATLRSAIALKIKRYSLTKSYKFITDFNRHKYPRVGGAPVAQRNWFALTKKQRNAVVLEHYKKTHFTHLDEDMMAPIARIIKKAAQFEPAPGPKTAGSTTKSADGVAESSSSSSSSSIVAAGGDWDRRETTLLLRAWRDTVDSLQHPKTASQSSSAQSLETRIYQRFVVLSEGDASRSEHDVTMRRVMLTNTYDVIVAYNKRTSGAGSWFAMRRSERKALLGQTRRPCVADLDEATFTALERILDKHDLAVSERGATPPPPPLAQPSPVYTKGLNVWSNDEVVLLIQAWAAVATEGASVENEPLYVFNSRIYKKFLELARGRTLRTDKALIAKRESVLQSYHFIHDYHQDNVASLPSDGRPRDWFALDPADQKYIVKVHFKKTSFSYLDSAMMALLDAFLEPHKTTGTAPVKRIKVSPSAASVPATPTSYDLDASAPVKPRPNAWTRDELFLLLRAWREIAMGDPRSAKESLGGFNARIHQRFAALARASLPASVVIKPETSVRSKRQLLTSTFEFISDFNRKNFLDWFSLRESDRKKHIVNANRVTHTCSNIEEDVFEALGGILGDTKIAAAGTRPSSAVLRAQRHERMAATATGDDDSDAIDGARARGGGDNDGDDDDDARSASSSHGDRDDAPTSTTTQAERKRHLVANVLAHIGETSRASPSVAASDSPVRKKARTESSSSSDLSVIAQLFEAQTQHLASLLEQVKAERRIEHNERRALLARIQFDQEERERDRAERKAEREHMQREWEAFREERRAEREQDRLLLQALLAQKEASAEPSKSASGQDVSESEPVRHS